MTTIGFIGLGVMGGAMCRNVAAKHPGTVLAFDLSTAARDALASTSAHLVSDIAEIWSAADIVLLSLPGGKEVEAVCLGSHGLLTAEPGPRVVIDLSTTSVATARKIAQELGQHGVAFADAPVARTREAALRGELSIMVGAPSDLYAEIEPTLRHMGTDVMHIGPVGSGQFVKLINNALLDINVIAIAEAIGMAERAGVDPAVMVEAVSKGSGDSYALHHHAPKSMLPRTYPEKSFPPEYKIKDLTYLLELAADLNTPARSMELALRYYEETIAAGYGGRYFTAVREFISASIPVRGAATPSAASPSKQSR